MIALLQDLRSDLWLKLCLDYDVAYSETFFEISKPAFVRLFISLVAFHHWLFNQLDIKNAFLHGDLNEEVNTEQPPGFVSQGKYEKVCHMRKSFYGLKKSPRSWFGKFSDVV